MSHATGLSMNGANFGKSLARLLPFGGSIYVAERRIVAGHFKYFSMATGCQQLEGMAALRYLLLHR